MSFTYNPSLVLISAFIAVSACFIALELSGLVSTAARTLQKFWLVGGAIALGTGIWSMHFVAMLAVSMPIAVNYNSWVVLLSLLAAILAAFQALYVMTRPAPTIQTLLVSSSLMGGGIATMHYLGMAAMQMPAKLRYDFRLFFLSIGIAIVVSLAAQLLFLLFRSNHLKGSARRWFKVLSAIVMGGAILSMHYTGMAAAIVEPLPAAPSNPPGLDHLSLAYLVCLVTVLVLGMMLSLVYIDPHRTTSFPGDSESRD